MLKFNTFLPYFTFNPSLSELIESENLDPPNFSLCIPLPAHHSLVYKSVGC